ncbi:type II 3-dehydroquinate dehydratase [bacterium]|nr:type II 3-dehydroquinate dehydratase [bacterium]
MRLHIINGPNLNLLGRREPELYGHQSFEAGFRDLRALFPGLMLEYYQSNIEGELIDHIHSAGFVSDGLIVNAGGYSHTSVALGDALAAVPAPAVEVHLSNTLARESFRHTSMLARSCIGVVMGFGMDSYRLGIEALMHHRKNH